MTSRFIPETLINEIRQQINIVEIISEYVPLNKAGSNYKGLCPFHTEKTPSFVVSPQKQIFHCYGCGAAGNVFAFLMQYEKYTFPEAVQALAKRAGISLPTDAPSQESRRLQHIYQLHQDAARYFSQLLMQDKQGEKARNYLKQRGIQDQIIQTFALGYASPEWDDMQKHFSKRYSPELLLESGLVLKKKNGIGHYDRFRDRLMIPIRDEQGRIVAFGGRIMGDGEPKYLNSPESPIFHKGRVLFGFSFAKDAARRNNHIILVEGYFDMIVPYSYGIANIAATMGTALTAAHLHLIQRCAKHITLIFDPDPAGIKAVQRTLDLFLESGFEVGNIKAVLLPHGDDPDTAVRKMGTAAFQEYIVSKAFMLFDFIFERIKEKYDLSQPDQRIKCANEIFPTIAKISNILERNRQLSNIADIFKMPEADSAVFEEFKKFMGTGKPKISQPVIEKQQATSIPPIEKYLMKALVKNKSLIPYVQEHLRMQDLSHPLSRRVMQELFVYNDKTDFEARMLEISYGTVYQAMLAELFMGGDEIVDPETTIRDCIRRLKQKGFDYATLDTTRNVKMAQERKDGEFLQTFLEQKNKDLQQKKKIGALIIND